MRCRVVAAFVFVVLSTWMLSTATTGAQTLPSVTVAATRQGESVFPCPPASPYEGTPAQFVLTRTGDTTAGLTVTIVWSGDATTEAIVSPTSVEFAPGSATATVTPTFAPSPARANNLTLTIVAGAGYEPGDPSTASTMYVLVVCDIVPRPPQPPPPQPPPLQLPPTFTG